MFVLHLLIQQAEMLAEILRSRRNCSKYNKFKFILLPNSHGLIIISLHSEWNSGQKNKRTKYSKYIFKNVYWFGRAFGSDVAGFSVKKLYNSGLWLETHHPIFLAHTTLLFVWTWAGPELCEPAFCHSTPCALSLFLSVLWFIPP